MNYKSVLSTVEKIKSPSNKIVLNCLQSIAAWTPDQVDFALGDRLTRELVYKFVEANILVYYDFLSDEYFSALAAIVLRVEGPENISNLAARCQDFLTEQINHVSAPN